MKHPQQFNYQDILWAPAKALSAKRIFVMTFFICMALALYDIFTYIALVIDGEKLKYIISVYGLFPFYKIVYSNILAQIIFSFGMVFSIITLMLGFFGVSAIEMEDIRGNRFLSAFKAIKFSIQRLKQIFLSELAIIVFIAFIILLLAIFGLICRIPFIGEWLYALFFVIPNFVIAIFTVFIFVVLQVSIILLPAVAASERNGESFNALLETFSTVIRQPVRWGLYTVYSLVSAKVCSFVYAYFCYRSVQFLTWSTNLGGGENIKQLVKSGLSHLPVKSDVVRETFNIFPGIDWSVSLAKYARGGSDETTGYLMAVMLFLIFASIIGYLFSVIAVGQSRGYVVIRYIKDGYKISDEEPLFGEEGEEGFFNDKNKQNNNEQV